jgi:hypothetical protein
MGGIGKGKETKNLNLLMCLLNRMNRNLKLAEAIMRRGLGRSEEVW